jgi:2Fe-2S ferredoxin
MGTITFVDSDGRAQPVPLVPGKTVMQHALDHGIRGILADCGGTCSCATCHCYLDAAWVSRFPAAPEQEAELVSFAFDPQPNSRLACQLLLGPEHDGLVIGLPRRQI